MPLVTTKQMLLDAQKGHYAIGAFNIENMEMAQAVIAAAEEAKSPVIIQTTPSTLRYAPPYLYAAMVTALAQRASVPVALHLDHCESLELASQALDAGYSSIMIDGSKHPFEENIAITSSAVALCTSKQIPVEAELGKLGGKEDDLDGGAGGGLTDPEEAQQFVQRTGVGSLAVAIGTAHGIYKDTPKIDVQRLREIRQVVSVPLVLHGASGVDHDVVRACIAEGICKVNFATELRIAFSTGVKDVLNEKPDTFDPKAYNKVARERVIALVKNCIAFCGSEGKA